MSESTTVLNPFILSWNLRNIVEESTDITPEKFCITGTCLGEYPIDAWKQYLLEVPLKLIKKDIVGRTTRVLGIGIDNTEWDKKRVILLPRYLQAPDSNISQLEHVIKHWTEIGLPDDIPCICIAVKCRGFYSDYREVKHVTVLTIWNDTVARIISLDWCEGPLEDCITPEWFVESSPLLALKDAINKIENVYVNTKWDGSSFSIFTIPLCLGYCLKGEKNQVSKSPWDYKWNYDEYTDFKDNLNVLLSNIQNIFFKDVKEGNENE